MLENWREEKVAALTFSPVLSSERTDRLLMCSGVMQRRWIIDESLQSPVFLGSNVSLTGDSVDFIALNPSSVCFEGWKLKSMLIMSHGIELLRDKILYTFVHEKNIGIRDSESVICMPDLSCISTLYSFTELSKAERQCFSNCEEETASECQLRLTTEGAHSLNLTLDWTSLPLPHPPVFLSFILVFYLAPLSLSFLSLGPLKVRLQHPSKANKKIGHIVFHYVRVERPVLWSREQLWFVR